MSELVSVSVSVLKGIQTIVKNVKNFPKIKDKVESLLTCTMSVLKKFRPGEDSEKIKVVTDLKKQLIKLKKLANDMTAKPGQESWTSRAWTMFQKSLDTYGKRYDAIHKEIDEILNTMTNFLSLDSANFAQDSANMLKELLNEKNKRYTGSFAKDLRSGSGRFVMANGGYYDGNWKNDKREGNGEQQYHNGSQYNGEWKNDNRDGSGIFKDENGYVYDGKWKNDKKHGKGKTRAKGRTSVYEAVFELGNAISGEIAKKYNDGLYKGNVLNDQRHGSGKMEYNNGDVYKGNWVADKKHGQGKYTKSSGDVYEGDWNAGNMDGKGKLSWADGSAFDGNWKQNCPFGSGKFTCQNGHTIHGARFYQEASEPTYSCFCFKDGETDASYVAFGGNDTIYTLTIPGTKDSSNIEVSGLWRKTVLRIGTERNNYYNEEANVNPAKLKQGTIKWLSTGNMKDVPPNCLRFEDISPPAENIKPKAINTGNSKGVIDEIHHRRMVKIKRLSQQMRLKETRTRTVSMFKDVPLG